MQINEHRLMRQTNLRYAHLCTLAEQHHEAWEATRNELARELPVDNGYYCMWGDGSVRPAQTAPESD